MPARTAKGEAATARYRDVNTALSEGFIPDRGPAPGGKCVTAATEDLPPE